MNRFNHNSPIDAQQQLCGGRVRVSVAIVLRVWASVTTMAAPFAARHGYGDSGGF